MMPDAFVGVKIQPVEFDVTPYVPYELGEKLPTNYIDNQQDPVIAEIFDKHSKAQTENCEQDLVKVREVALEYGVHIVEESKVPYARKGKIGLLGYILDGSGYALPEQVKVKDRLIS
jgi:hypothetical protein